MMSAEPIRPEIPPARFAHMIETAEGISAQLADLIKQAHVEGVKDGIEFSASYADQWMVNIKNADTTVWPVEHQVAIHGQLMGMEMLRDRLRLVALDIGASSDG